MRGVYTKDCPYDIICNDICQTYMKYEQSYEEFVRINYFTSSYTIFRFVKWKT